MLFISPVTWNEIQCERAYVFHNSDGFSFFPFI